MQSSSVEILDRPHLGGSVGKEFVSTPIKDQHNLPVVSKFVNTIENSDKK